MGILRATKYKTFLKLSAAVFLLSAVIGTGLFTSLKVSALPPEIPMSWADSAHANAVDNKGNVYGSVGYGCVVGSLTVIGGDGKSISNDSGLGKNITASDKSSIPGCNSGSAAQYIWLYTDTTTSNSARYALIVYPGGKPVNPKSCVVTASPAKNSTECSAAIWKVDTSSGALNNPPVKSSFGIKLDTSTQATVTNAITNNNQSSSLNASCPENAFSWMICPVISMAVGAANTFDGQITCLMQIDLSDVFGASSNDTNPYRDACGTSSDIATIAKTSNAYYHAWNTFRSLALALIVIAGLIMVISQAAGAELLDAYAIRKILPRLLIAGVAITLSWQLMEFLIQLTNVVGYGVRDIIYYPFNSFSGLTISGIGASLLGLMATGGAIIALGAPGLLLLALTAVLGAVVAFITLILRKLVIVFLLMLAPLAIACYILPNTQKVWKLWWDTLSKALLMFPIIAAMIAVGHVFAATSYGSGNGGAISQTIAFIAYFLPYFMIPTAVRMAGGAVGSIGGMISKASQGGFAGLSKRRSAITQERRHNATARAKGGDIVRGRFANTRAGTALNRGTQNITTGYKGRFGFGERGTAATDAFRDDATAQFMKTSAFTNNANNDHVLRAAAVGRNRAEAVSNLQSVFGYSQADAEKHAAQAEATIGYSQAARQAASMQLVSTGTGYDNIEQMTRTLALASNGNSNTISRLAGFANADTKNRGRFDLAPGFSDLQSLVIAEAAGSAPGSTVARPTTQAYQAASVKAARGQDSVSLLRGKPKEVETLTKTLASHLQYSWSRANDANLSQQDQDAAMEEVLQTSAQIKNLDDSKGYSSPENQSHVNNMLNDTNSERTGLRSLVQGTTYYKNRWDQLSPPPKNPNDPNLP